MRGRKRLPTAMHILRGRPSHRPLPENEPTPDALPTTAVPPPFLEGVARAEWLRLAPLLLSNGLLTVLDSDALGMYCHAFAQWQDATRKLATEGTVVKSKNGFLAVSPYIHVASKASITMRALMVEFGLTPSARTKVKTTPKLDAGNPLDKFIKRR
jgi:P27 family predicted phage terminase small subunit